MLLCLSFGRLLAISVPVIFGSNIMIEATVPSEQLCPLGFVEAKTAKNMEQQKVKKNIQLMGIGPDHTKWYGGQVWLGTNCRWTSTTDQIRARKHSPEPHMQSTKIEYIHGNKTELSSGRKECRKHCQRHNGPEGWVHHTKVTCLGHITSSYTNLDQTSSESHPSTNFKISTKH